jgi:hypothetical protein
MIDPTTIPRRLRRAIKPAVYGYRGLTAGLRMLPDFVIIGAQRAGTTYLYESLARHPDIAPALTKEVHFFDVWFGRGLRWYRSFFPLRLARRLHRRPLLAGEASPYYLFHPHAARRAAATQPKLRLIALLRNPVDRAYSHYQHSRRRGAEQLAFDDALAREGERLAGEQEKLEQDERYISYNHQNYSYQARGIYVDQLARWRSAFPREQLLVVQSEQLYAEPQAEMTRVLAFLGLPPHPSGSDRRPRSPGYPPMAAATRRMLLDYFVPHNMRLYEFLGQSFDWEK